MYRNISYFKICPGSDRFSIRSCHYNCAFTLETSRIKQNPDLGDEEIEQKSWSENVQPMSS